MRRMSTNVGLMKSTQFGALKIGGQDLRFS